MTSTAGWKKCFAIIHVFLALVIMAAAASASFQFVATKALHLSSESRKSGAKFGIFFERAKKRTGADSKHKKNKPLVMSDL